MDNGTQDGKGNGMSSDKRPQEHDTDTDTRPDMHAAARRFRSDAEVRQAVGKALREAAYDGNMLGTDGFDTLVRQLVTQTAEIPFMKSNGCPSLEQIEGNDYAWLVCLADLIDPVAAPWIPNEVEGDVYCGRCGAWIAEYARPPYCEHCGTRVMAPQEEDRYIRSIFDKSWHPDVWDDEMHTA